MEAPNFKTNEELAELAETRNVHRFRSLGEVVVALGQEEVATLWQLRAHAYSRLAQAQEDISVVEEEIAKRSNQELEGFRAA